MGLEKSLPQIIKAIEQVETKGEGWVTHTAILGIVLISIFLVGGVFAMLAYRYFSQRILEKNQQQSVSGKGFDGPSLHAAKQIHH